MRKLGGIAMVALCAVAATLVPAEAATVVTVSRVGNVVTVQGTEGVDDLILTTECAELAQCVEVNGPASMAAGSGCTVYTSGIVQCPVTGAPTIQVSLLGGHDDFSVGTLQETRRDATVRVDAGPGNDLLYGSGAVEHWTMGEGDDYLEPDASYGAFTVGPDSISGGNGVDHVNYLYSDGDLVSGLTVTFDGLANDGTKSAGDLDNVRPDVEQLTGTNNADTLTGSDAAQAIDGAAGDDVISGGGGDDRLDGADGADQVDGGPGADTLFGGGHDDRILGGPGTDTITGDSSDLTISGNDTVEAADGEVDVVSCGPGVDAVNADQADGLATAPAPDACEQVTRVGAPPPPPPTPAAQAATLARRKVDANPRRTKATLRLACPAGPAACTGTVKVRARKAKVGKGAFEVVADSTGKTRITLTRKARALLRTSRRVRVKVSLVQDGGSSTSKAVLTR